MIIKNKIIKNFTGLTLLELIISLTIVSILSFISYSSLQNVKLTYNRKEAQSQLIKLKSMIQEEAIKYGCSTPDVAIWLQGTTTSCTALTSQTKPTIVTPNNYYNITVSVDASNNIKLTATPVANKNNPQTNDSSCTSITLQLNSDGSDDIKSSSPNNSSGSTTSDPCWQ